MSKYPIEDSDLPTKDELAHIPHANPYWYSDSELSQIVEGSVTARATRIQPRSVEMWGREYRLLLWEERHGSES